jgi:hypothetical protein
MKLAPLPLTAAALWLTCAASLPAAPAIQVLILTGHDSHDWRSTTPYLRQLLTNTGRFEVRVEEEPAGITAATLANFDLLILHYHGPRLPPATENAILNFVRQGKGAVALHAANQPSKLIGAEPPAAEAERRVFTVKFTDPRHPITAGLPPTFQVADVLFPAPHLEPGTQVLATANDMPQLWVHPYGQGRVCYTPLGHDLAALEEPVFATLFTRAAEWAATGKVEPPARPEPALRTLVVTGGHVYETSFYRLFDSFNWTHVVSNHEAFQKDFRAKFDVLVLYDMESAIGEQEKQNLRNFVESNKGVVVLHHAVADYNDWPWWYHDVVGGKYQLKATPDLPGSTYIHGRDEVIHPVAGVPGLVLQEMHIIDETYKGMWISPDVKVLLRSDDPTSDGPVAWISPYPKSRVICIQLGHDHTAHDHPAYRDLVKSAILWAGRRQ